VARKLSLRARLCVCGGGGDLWLLYAHAQPPNAHLGQGAAWWAARNDTWLPLLQYGGGGELVML
jgi:hypothetical protein